VTGPAAPRVLALDDSSIVLAFRRAGSYRVAVHYSPYLAAPDACVRASADGMIVLKARHPGTLKLSFAVTAEHALAAISGSRGSC
jgi:hypothetical protein